MSALLLSGVRVIKLTRVLSGPFLYMILGDPGAVAALHGREQGGPRSRSRPL